MSDMTVATTIFEQLGGCRFRAMTGAMFPVGDDNSLTFRLPSNFAKNGINLVRVELTPMDVYTVTFSRHRAGKVTEVSKHTDIYNDQLVELFERVTGLRTRL